MVSVWWMINTRSKYVSWSHIGWNYLGFLIILSIVALCVWLGVDANNK